MRNHSSLPVFLGYAKKGRSKQSNFIRVYTMLLFSLFTSGFLNAQTVTGSITSGVDGMALPGVTIMEVGTSNGVVSDFNGNYSITPVDQDAVLRFSSIGFLTQEIEVGNQTIIDVVMEEDIARLDEVVVVGYGVQKKSDLTAAISSVNAEDLPSGASMSINNMIQGRVPGVEITPANGMPGAGVSVKIRGVSTMNNSEPLYVVDGVHIRNDIGTQGNTLAMINPNDIASIEILKDAASTAIYGAGGANGVILITTKKGQIGKPKVTFKTSYGIAQTPKMLNVLKADAYVDLLFEEQMSAYPAEDTLSKIIGPTLLDETYSRVDRTDWQKETFRNAQLYQADMSVGGGNEYSTYMFSLGYADQEAIVIGGEYKRYTMRIATDHKIGKRLTIGQNFNLGYTNRRDIGGAGRDYITNALRMAPYVPIYDESNWWGYGNNNNVNDNNNADNPFTSVEYLENRNKDARFIGNVYGKLEIIDGLSYYATASINFSQHFGSNFERAHVNSNEALDALLYTDISYGLFPKFEQTLTYSKVFGNHGLTVLLGSSMDRYGAGGSLSLRGDNFPNENLPNIMLAGNSILNDASTWVASGLSYFGRLNYSFANKYLLTAIVRRDGSDKFSSENRWGTFPSLSAAWKIHQEDFIADAIPMISNMKLRAGWGRVGIDAIDQFLYSSFIHSFGMAYPVGQPGAETYLSGSTIKALSSPDIKWEEATTVNIGLDLGLMKNKLNLTLDYFMKETSDILVAVPNSPSMGLGLTGGAEGGSRVANAATAINNGIEVLLSYTNYDGEFKYGVTANFTYLKNEVTGLGEGEPITGPSYNGQAHMTYTDIGHPIGAFYGFIVDKIYTSQAEIDADNAAAVAAGGEYYQSELTTMGDIRFLDLDENGYITDDDRDFIGSPIPKYTYGLAFDASYKGFDFSMNLSGIAGVDIYSAFYTWNMLGMRLTSNHLTDVEDRYSASNQDASLPRAISNDPNNNLRTSTRYLYNGSFLKIRNISVGYNFTNTVFTDNGISTLRVFGTVQNPITISDYIGYDPEVSSYNDGDASGYNLGRGIDQGFVPIPRTFLIGIEASF